MSFDMNEYVKKNEFYFQWESEFGLVDMYITAPTLAKATAHLKALYPEDIGSNGIVITPNDDEKPINW